MNTLLILLQIFPLALSAVQAVEQAIPLPGQGKPKLDLVLDVIKSAYDASTELTAAFSWPKLVSLVVPMIDKIVALHNALGLFKKSTPAPGKA
jgi:hypothetical protein